MSGSFQEKIAATGVSRSRSAPVSFRGPAPYQQEDAQENNRPTTQDHARQKASWIQANTASEANRPPPHPQDLRRPSREAPQPGHRGRHLQRPLPPRRGNPPLDLRRELTRVGIARTQSTQEGASRSRILHEQERPGSGAFRQDRAPRSLPACEEIQAEPQVPSSRIDTTNSRGKASSIGPETPGMVQGSTHRIEYRQLSFDGPDADFNPEVHAPTRPLFSTEAEQLSLSLHQLLNNNRRRRDRVPANPHRTHVKIRYRPRGTQL